MSDNNNKCHCWSCKKILILVFVLLLGAGGLWWWSCNRSCDYQEGFHKKDSKIATHGGKYSKKDCARKHCDKKKDPNCDKPKKHCDKSVKSEKSKDCHKESEK